MLDWRQVIGLLSALITARANGTTYLEIPLINKLAWMMIDESRFIPELLEPVSESLMMTEFVNILIDSDDSLFSMMTEEEREFIQRMFEKQFGVAVQDGQRRSR